MNYLVSGTGMCHCGYLFGFTIQSGDRIPTQCNTCKTNREEIEEFNSKMKNTLDSIQIGYLSPHE